MLGHKGELARDDGHHGLLWNGVAVVGNASASGVMLGLEYVLAKNVPRDVEEGSLRCREETLPDATADIEIMVVRYLFLVL